jgi:ribosomal protein S18 acetylase RimI-like enzyme
MMTTFAPLTIRLANVNDAAAIWRIIEPTIRAGETYALPQDLSREAGLDYWLGADRQTFVAEAGGEILGTYFVRPNQLGRGAHICNCGYMTAAEATGQGVARAMCGHSLDHARSKGFLGMQYNFVISSNDRAVRLWESMGFAIVGRSPGAFHHPTLGYVDALVMYRRL